MTNALEWAKSRLLGTEGVEKPYECVKCNLRLARQPFNCPECGCYRVNWIEWQENRELIE